MKPLRDWLAALAFLLIYGGAMALAHDEPTTNTPPGAAWTR